MPPLFYRRNGHPTSRFGPLNGPDCVKGVYVMSSHYGVDIYLDEKIPMRDGVSVSANIYRPQAEGCFPTILIRTPYSNNDDQHHAKGRALACMGYACVIPSSRYGCRNATCTTD